MIELTGKRAFVTGCGRGIGQAIAIALAEHGCRVAVNDLTPELLDDTARQIRSTGSEPLLAPGDVSSSVSVNAVLAEVTGELGGVDILVNNAGVISALLVEDISDEEWDRVIRVNLTAMFYTSRALASQFKMRRSGKIVNIASTAGKTASKFHTHYCASKFGVIGFTQALAMELAPFHVNVNCICPTWCETNMMASMAEVYANFEQKPADVLRKEWAEANPWGRMTQPLDVAKMCVFLASDYAEFVTGQAINVSGGEEVH